MVFDFPDPLGPTIAEKDYRIKIQNNALVDSGEQSVLYGKDRFPDDQHNS